MINYSYYLQQIENLFKLEPNPKKHNPETTDPHNISRIKDGCNRIVYIPKQVVTSCQDTNALHEPRVALKVNKIWIKPEEEKRMRENMEFLRNMYEVLWEIGKDYGLVIPDFHMDLIADKQGRLRLTYVEPDIGNLFKDPRSVDLAYEEIHKSAPEKILKDAKTLQTIQNIISLTERFYKQTQKLKTPMLPDIWGSFNIAGITNQEALTSLNIPSENLAVVPQNAHTLLANSSIIKANNANNLFNQGLAFRSVILEVLESFKRIINEQKFTNPLPTEALFQAAHLKTWISKTTGLT
jgi:hypothetical protein